MICPGCENEVPRDPFCVRCGEPLANRDSPYPHERRGYAAAPNEHWFLPGVVSSIFPHLPRSDMRPFRVALVSGTALMVALCLFDLFPLALVSAAALVPFLFVLYVWDVDLYEEEPLRMLGFTVGWGAVGGVALGLAARHLASSGLLLQGGTSTHNLFWLGVFLPSVAFSLAIAGPLVLLPHRSFNDVLDGVTFGGSCAVTLVGAEAITNSAGFLHDGFRAAGDRSLWVARLLTLGIAMPVLAAALAGVSCGAFWLKLRSRARDRGSLGPFGSPLVTVPTGCGALVGAYVAALYAGQWTTLAITAALACGALVWLRWMIHLGLGEEAGERPIGPPIRCPNCRRETPEHSFCAHCGVSLRALPKDGAQGTYRVDRHGARRHAVHQHGVQRHRPARMGLAVKLTAFAALAAAAVGLAAVAIVLTRPAGPKPPCSPGVPCASPPRSPVAAPHAVAAAFQSGTPWTSSLGVTVRYPSSWDRVAADNRTLIVKADTGTGVFVAVAVLVDPSSVGPVEALDDQLAIEGKSYLGIERDTSGADTILSPELGFVHGIAASYRATVDEPPSPTEQVEVAFEAATHGGATVVVEAITNQAAQGRTASSPFPDFQAVDDMLDSLTWTVDT